MIQKVESWNVDVVMVYNGILKESRKEKGLGSCAIHKIPNSLT